MTEDQKRINRILNVISAYDILMLCLFEYVKPGDEGPALRKAQAELRAAKANLEQGDLVPVD